MWTIHYEKTNLVGRHHGTLPVILSCPHDGEESPSGVPERTGKGIPSDCPPFKKSRDLHTREITTRGAQRMLDVFGEEPYVVIAEFHRKFIDANRPDRPQNCAYEDPAAQPFYDEYHNTLREFVNEIRAEHGGLGLLFDIHGTQVIDTDPADLYLGTDNGNSVARLLDVDEHALFRRQSLRGFLEAAGHVVSPKEPGIPENPAVDGGHTVRTYGSSNVDGLDAIQIEIASTLRNDAQKRADLIETLAYAIGNLVPRYADVHTLAAFQSIRLLNGDVIPIVSGQLQRRPDANDCLLQLGGQFQNRGRVEIRNDPGAKGQPAPRRAGVLLLYGETGNDYYLWVDNQGKLRISPSDPGANSQAGTIVGVQK
jgi:N-formylglutamate amidohydrolase